jgi:hypothetical protein
MERPKFISRVKLIDLAEIKPSDDNPRGPITRNESFERLAASINRVGILVPLVVTELRRPVDRARYELVDGERRYLAAKELAMDRVPVHIVDTTDASAEARRLMFHLHMTREQWEPIAQCRSLIAAYPELEKGLRFSEKQAWVKKLADETNMPSVTARDRIHVLAWPAPLKNRIFEFDVTDPSKNIYSYVLALEASVIVPSLDAFPSFYNGNKPAEPAANRVRASLLDKTIAGLETGVLRTREQIRAASPLFTKSLNTQQKQVALSVFKNLIRRSDFQFDDVSAEITTRLPELLEEKAPKPRRVTSMMLTLTRILEKYDPTYITDAAGSPATKRKIHAEFVQALEDLLRAASDLESRI